MNPLLLIDGYKLDHRRQYPPGTTGVYSNWTPRMSRIAGVDRVVFFGLQYFLQRYLMDEWSSQFFDCVSTKMVRRYTQRVNGYLGPNQIGTKHIEELAQLGYLPLEFRAIPEGFSVPLRVPALTVENTHPDFAWLVNYFETLMSCILWMPCTTATQAKLMRSILDKAAELTGSPKEFVDWQGHDFSFRGMPGLEAAEMSGASHLLYFTGTDTVPALDWIEDFYGPLPANYLLGGSVAATEHSVMCAGTKDDELGTFNRLLDLYPSGIVSVVSDTWDLWNVLTKILPQLKERILARPGKLVIRPDSGDPVDIICGNNEAVPGTPAHKGVIQLLWELFGGTTTSTGHKLLDSHIGCIYGDSITFDRARTITQRLQQRGFASANMVFGIGSYSYQYVTRDTLGFAMKATWAEVGGEGRSLFKRPVTDDGVKNSARGRLAVLPRTKGDLDQLCDPTKSKPEMVAALTDLELINDATPEQEANSVLLPVWRDGQFIRRWTFDEVRRRARLDHAAAMLELQGTRAELAR